MSCKYEPGTLRRTRIYVNAAFARLSGVHPEEMVARCGKRGGVCKERKMGGETIRG